VVTKKQRVRQCLELGVGHGVHLHLATPNIQRLAQLAAKLTQVEFARATKGMIEDAAAGFGGPALGCGRRERGLVSTAASRAIACSGMPSGTIANITIACRATSDPNMVIVIRH